MFKLEAISNRARAGVLKTQRGEIKTPVFMPVGTRASVKTMSVDDLNEIDAKIILANTYHLYLRPGHNLIEKLGGLHEFMGKWQHSILTDSGGFQVYSLSSYAKICDDGVEFSSHIDGSKHFIDAKKSMEIQRALGSDIVMAWDLCPALPASNADLNKSVELTINWAKICRDYPLDEHQKLFAIVQGGLDFSLRKKCLSHLQDMDFYGYAIGGLSVGEKNSSMVEFLQEFTPLMPTDKPRYLMGVGKPIDILEGIKSGIDMFDCVYPSRNARNGQAITSFGTLNIKNKKYKEDSLALDPKCKCKVCKTYSRAYIRHLFLVGEYLGGQLLTYHNLYFYMHLTRRAREAILSDRFDEFYIEFYKDISKGD